MFFFLSPHSCFHVFLLPSSHLILPLLPNNFPSFLLFLLSHKFFCSFPNIHQHTLFLRSFPILLSIQPFSNLSLFPSQSFFTSHPIPLSLHPWRQDKLMGGDDEGGYEDRVIDIEGALCQPDLTEQNNVSCFLHKCKVAKCLSWYFVSRNSQMLYKYFFL